MISHRLIAALQALQNLTDDDHRLLDTWFALGTRQHLYANGLSDDDIGPTRENDYPESDTRIPPAMITATPKPRLLTAVHALRSLTNDEMKAVAEWFYFADRHGLISLGATQEQIGPWRTDLDEIETDDFRYPVAVQAEVKAQALS